MTSYALITEGITDQAVLDLIIQEIHASVVGEESDIRPLQPPRDATDVARASDFGGWEKVIEHCSVAARIREALAINDYLVIQIDTDQCDHVNFGVSRTDEGNPKTVSKLIEETTLLLKHKIGSEIITEQGHRIIFAICVHSIECWLLPFYEDTLKGKMRTLECEHHLSRALTKKSIPFKKEYRTYRSLAKPLAKAKGIQEASKINESLAHLVRQVTAAAEATKSMTSAENTVTDAGEKPE